MLRNRRIFVGICLGLLMSLFVGACQRNLSDDGAATADCRMIQHTLGETCVPVNPERLVVLGSPTMVNAITLGLTPVGAIRYYEDVPQYLQGKIEDIELVGDDDQPNLEKILSLRPDLIIAMNDWSLPYGQMSQIAPTVVDDWQGYASWKEHFNFVAEVLGKTIEAQQAWASYEQRVQELRAALGDRYQDAEISVFRVCCNVLASDVKNSFSGIILNDVGLRRPPGQNKAEGGGLVIFPEELMTESIDGDIMFAIVDTDADSQEIFEQVQQEPLWQKLVAVKKDQVYVVETLSWRGGNLLAADVVIDDLFKYLVEEQPS